MQTYTKISTELGYFPFKGGKEGQKQIYNEVHQKHINSWKMFTK